MIRVTVCDVCQKLDPDIFAPTCTRCFSYITNIVGANTPEKAEELFREILTNQKECD